MGGGANHLAAGAAAALALPLAVFALGLPFVVAIMIAAALYAGVALVAAPRQTAERIDFTRIGKAQAQLVASLIEDGEAVVARLKVAKRGLRSPSAAATTGHLAEIAQASLDRLAAAPDKLPAVRRFLGYYLPRSAELAEGLAVVERQRVPDVKRQAEIEAVLGRLDQAFSFYADSLDQGELDTLDVELKLIGRALADDLGGPSAPSAGKQT